MSHLPTWLLGLFGTGAGILIKEGLTVFARKRSEKFWDKQLKSTPSTAPKVLPSAQLVPVVIAPFEPIKPLPMAVDVQLLAKEIDPKWHRDGLTTFRPGRASGPSSTS